MKVYKAIVFYKILQQYLKKMLSKKSSVIELLNVYIAIDGKKTHKNKNCRWIVCRVKQIIQKLYFKLIYLK